MEIQGASPHPAHNPLPGMLWMPSKEIEPLAVALLSQGQALAVHLPTRVGPGLGLGLPSQGSPPCVCLWELQPPRGHRAQEAVWKIAPENWQVECKAAAVPGRGAMGRQKCPQRGSAKGRRAVQIVRWGLQIFHHDGKKKADQGPVSGSGWAGVKWAPLGVSEGQQVWLRP